MLRPFRSLCATLALALMALAALPPTPAHAVMNALDPVPAATVLFPYFEVDLANPGGATTLLTVANSSASAALVRVTIWSDANLPVFSFPIYLTGYDLASINVRDILNGILPTSATAGGDPSDTISPKGPVSQDINFSSCNGNPQDPGSDRLPMAALGAGAIADLRAALTGAAVPNGTLIGVAAGQCTGRNYGDNVARGYITMDSVFACYRLTPANGATYFGNGGIADTRNILWGEYTVVDPANNLAYGDLATMIEAVNVAPVAGTYTFYGRFVGADGSDKREGLATSWLVQGERDSTQMQYWRDTRIALNPAAVGFSCGTSPAPQPMGRQFAGAFNFDSTPDNAPVATIFGTPIAKVPLSNADTGMTSTKKIGQFRAGLRTTIVDPNVVVFSAPTVVFNPQTGQFEAGFAPDPSLTQGLITSVRRPKSGAGRFQSGAVSVPMDQVATPDSFNPLQN